jgi:hypothetical protein
MTLPENEVNEKRLYVKAMNVMKNDRDVGRSVSMRPIERMRLWAEASGVHAAEGEE